MQARPWELTDIVPHTTMVSAGLKTKNAESCFLTTPVRKLSLTYPKSLCPQASFTRYLLLAPVVMLRSVLRSIWKVVSVNILFTARTAIAPPGCGFAQIWLTI